VTGPAVLPELDRGRQQQARAGDDHGVQHRARADVPFGPTNGEGGKRRHWMQREPRSARFGMLAFAIVFSVLVERSVVEAFAGASLAWLVVSVTAWFVRRKMRIARRARLGEEISGSAISRSRYG